MKKILVLILVLALVAAMTACTEVTRISVEEPAKLMIEKEGGAVAITLTDKTTVESITNVICQIPLKSAEPTEDQWTYRLVWQDGSGMEITRIEIAGGLIRWCGGSYKLGIGVDLSVITNALESIPGLNQ